MKNLYALLFAFILGNTYAQVPNNSFEEVTTDGNGLKNWGIAFVQLVTIDVETGEPVSDNIIFENGQYGFSFAVGDAHSGERAMELRNAFNQTQNHVVPGKARLFDNPDSEIATGWDAAVPIPANSIVDRLAFHYKFLPMGNDTAQATLQLFGESGELVGMAQADISQASSGYSYVSVPVESFSAEVPVSMTIEFSMAKEGSEPVFGSHLIIDDVAVNDTAMGIDNFQAEFFTIYPAVTSGILNIAKSETIDNPDITIVDVNGRIIKQLNESSSVLDVSMLPSGIYMLRATAKDKVFIKKFIKQ